MKIAVEGCAHGELDRIYDALEHLQKKENIKIDLLICCGDFQSTRNLDDLQCMAVPKKYQSMCSFYKYYSGEKLAPILTIFIGGNHEASNYLQELAYGGWVAPNIYYLGYASIINVAGVRIGGISGIYKGHDYMKGHFESPPYTEETKRSVYHIRNLEVFRLKQVQQPVHIFLSHDWPRGVYHYGDTNQLLKRKPFLNDEINSNSLGSKPCEELLHHLKPSFWFSAHLHVKFAAVIPHKAEANEECKSTKFLALDKCLPKRHFLQIVDIDHNLDQPIKLEYDLEWLTILHLTNHLISVKKGIQYMPGPGNIERFTFTPTAEEKESILKKFNNNLTIPENFSTTVTPYDGSSNQQRSSGQVLAQVNPQTMVFCDKLGIDDPMGLLLMFTSCNLNSSQVSTCSLPSFLTPEKPGDVTAVSLPEEESPAKPVRHSLNLPSPMNSHSINKSDVSSSSSLSLSNHFSQALCSSRESFNQISDIGDSELCGTSDSPSVKENFEESESSMIKNNSTSETPHPVVKKFKRRNESLYTSTNDDC